jgi:hypothetical protein
MFSNFESHPLERLSSFRAASKASRCSRFSPRGQKTSILKSEAAVECFVAEHKFKILAPAESPKRSCRHSYPACSSGLAVVASRPEPDFQKL